MPQCVDRSAVHIGIVLRVSTGGLCGMVVDCVGDEDKVETSEGT